MKRGQVTIFIVLALVILIIAGIGIYMFNKVKTTTLSLQRTPAGDDVKPIQVFVEDCVGNSAKEAVVLLGQHGGYIDPSNQALSGRQFSVDAASPEDRDFTTLNSGSNSFSTAIPYWYYDDPSGSCSNCVEKSNTPFIQDIEFQINAYAASKGLECLNNFSDFTARGYSIVPTDDLYVSSHIRDSDVAVQIYYPLTITYRSQTSTLKDYYSIVDIPLKKYYDLALNITQTEYSNGFLERMTLYLIYSYSGLDSKLLPPIFGRTSGYDLYFWSQSETMKKFDGLLRTTIPLMQLNNTQNYKIISSGILDTYEKNFYNYLTIPSSVSYPKTDVNFIYPGGAHTLVQPANGEIIGPFTKTQTGTSLTSPSKINDYNFYYDVSYPVIVEIRDEYKPGQFYEFLFSIEVNLKQNMRIQDYFNTSMNRIYWDPSFIKSEFTGVPPNANVVAGTLQGMGLSSADAQNVISGESNVDVPVVNMAQKLFCTRDQQNSSIHIKTYDAKTQGSLPNVDVSYGCGTYAICSLGQTFYNNLTRMSELIANTSSCLNGYVELSKAGYHTKRLPLSLLPGTNYNFGSVYMDMLVDKDVVIDKYSTGMISPTKVILSNSTPFGSTDIVILTFTRLPESEIDAPWEQTLVIKNDSPQSMQLIPGRYIITANLLNNDTWYIQKECAEQCVDLTPLNPFDSDKCEKYPSNDIDLTGMPKGGYSTDDKNPYIITYNQLYSNATLHIPVIQLPPPLCVNDVDKSDQLLQLSKIVKPTFE